MKVLFFAALREQIDCAELDWQAAPAALTVAELKQQLLQAHPRWQAAFNTFKTLYAVNQTLVAEDHPLQPDDEVAFFPPVTGG